MIFIVKTTASLFEDNKGATGVIGGARQCLHYFNAKRCNPLYGDYSGDEEMTSRYCPIAKTWISRYTPRELIQVMAQMGLWVGAAMQRLSLMPL